MTSNIDISSTKKVLAESGVEFGTSGARGLVENLTDDVCAAFALSFIACIKNEFEFSAVAVGIDNRPSSPALATAITEALKSIGIKPIYCGVLPTPALANYAMQRNIPCIMVTGSHISFNRNGLKFYRPDGEISKLDEIRILATDVSFSSVKLSSMIKKSMLVTDTEAIEFYVKRYTSLFTKDALRGFNVGVYEHSSSGRDLYSQIFSYLGANVTSLERSDKFISIDTEAVSIEDREKARDWSSTHRFDAIFSTDGDGDRPLLADENGEWLRGDILGLLTAKLCNIESLAVPVSCNSAIEKSKCFLQVARTKIGSPYVIEAFANLNRHYGSVAGFEANGGFLLGSNIELDGNTLHALPTRDAVLPALIVMCAAKKDNMTISRLVNELPKRFTASDRIKDFPTEKSVEMLARVKSDPEKFVSFLNFRDSSKKKLEFVELVDTDGLRLVLKNDDVIHLRPSGNAPELRCYAESGDISSAEIFVRNTLNKVINY